MNNSAQYYLHTNGSLIFKPHGGVETDSDFVKKVWSGNVIGKSPQSFVIWIKEAFDLGATRADINRVALSANIDAYIPDWAVQVFGIQQNIEVT